MIVVALEGPSCVGKTSTLAKLAIAIASVDANVLTFPCYSEALESAGPQACPASTEEQLRAFTTFMYVERMRVEAIARACPPPDLVMLDRSVDTLLAHCKAVDAATGSSSYASARRELAKRPYLIPDLTIYFDCPPEVIKNRARRERASLDDFFLDSEFLWNFPQHFQKSDEVVAREIHRTDATQAQGVITSEIADMLLSILGNN